MTVCQTDRQTESQSWPLNYIKKPCIESQSGRPNIELHNKVLCNLIGLERVGMNKYGVGNICSFCKLGLPWSKDGSSI